jgi:septum formation protein
MSVDLYLASASPRRRELLQQIGVRYAVLPVDVSEQHQPGETPEALVQRLACDKAQAGWSVLAAGDRKPVLGADTIVVCAGRILGKPRHRDEGIAMLQLLSGQTHQVLSAVAMSTGACSVEVNLSHVSFRDLNAAECAAYWDSGEPQDKAGGYAIQGRAAVFIRELRGSYSGVMGLPLYETARLLEQFQIPMWC